jgi:hypothetical protein
LLFGVFLSWGLTEKSANLLDERLDELTELINTNTRPSKCTQTSYSNTPTAMSSDFSLSGNELISKLKDELALVIVDELKACKSDMQAKVNNDPEKSIAIDADYERYYRAQSLLDSAVSGGRVTFQQFTSNESVINLPDEMRDKLMGEVAVKLNSGELNPEVFLWKND